MIVKLVLKVGVDVGVFTSDSQIDGRVNANTSNSTDIMQTTVVSSLLFGLYSEFMPANAIEPCQDVVNTMVVEVRHVWHRLICFQTDCFVMC